MLLLLQHHIAGLTRFVGHNLSYLMQYLLTVKQALRAIIPCNQFEDNPSSKRMTWQALFDDHEATP